MSHIQQLADYIKRNLKKGYTLDSLRFSLINQGYTRISIENALDITNKQLASELPKIKEKPEISYKIMDDNKNQKDNFFKSFFKRLFE